MKRIYYYQKTTDDVVDSHDQNFSLPDNYVILPNSLGARIWSTTARHLACAFGWVVFRFFDHYKILQVRYRKICSRIYPAGKKELNHVL